jgi:hypothetical protein
MAVTTKNNFLKISHGYVADTTVSDTKNQFLLNLKTVDVRSLTTCLFLRRGNNEEDYLIRQVILYAVFSSKRNILGVVIILSKQ